jgi:hypothetical protein
MTKNKALKLALEALEIEDAACRYLKEQTPSQIVEAITAIKEALAQPEQEPDYNICPTCGGMASDPIVPPEQRQPAPVQEPVAIDGNTSDGYHTFNELYEFRKAYNAALFNEWAAGGKCSVHKSWRHHDGELCFGGGWFIVVAVLPNGQISNHYEAKDWDLFAVPETERALFEFDGHTSADVIARLKAYTTPPQRKPLTDEQITKIYTKWECTKGTSWADLMRLVEAAHDIKE